jgi:arylsulfatase A-like enzyme/Flp pilus assembly protein TadD
MRWVRRSIFLLLWLAAVWVLAQAGARAAAGALPAETDQPASVILISIDTLRADHLSCYGYTRLRTPHIDALVRGGTLFAEISSQAPITLPSHVSLFTSTYPFANGIRENAQVLAPGAVTLATLLAARGYKTAAFIGGYFLARRYGLAQGFETYDSPFDGRGVNSALSLKRPAAQVLDAAQPWLVPNAHHPFLLFIHLFDLHQPYDPPAAYPARAPESEYDQELAYVDDALGKFFTFLAAHGIDRRALTVLFSDHGESLGDHGENTHGYFIYRSTLHVPLIFHWPQAEAARGRQTHVPRVDAPAGLIDVAPTILSFLGIGPPASFCGHSLMGLAGGDAPARDVYSESSYAHDKFGWAELRSLRRGDYQYIDAPRPELYDLKRDPAELHNLLPGQTALAASYRERLTALVGSYRAAPAEGAGTDAATAPGAAESLRSLGYLEITAPHAALDNAGVDPKDRLFEYKRYLMAGHLARIGKAQEAVAEFQSILADDPRNLPAYIELARSEIGLRRYLDAAKPLHAALALDPHNVEAAELLGDIWLTVGALDRAAAEFRQLLAFAPQDYEAHFGLGLLAARQHHPAEAVQHFRAALAANPDSAEAHYQLGLLHAAQKQNRDAAREFQAALAINPHYQAARRELDKLTPTGGQRR